MDANTFFGYTTRSSAYDARRHVNFFFNAFVSYNMEVNPSISSTIGKAMKFFNLGNIVMAAQYITSEVLTPDQNKFLEFLKKDKGLSDDEYKTIIAGISFTCEQYRTPAGYREYEHKLLMVQIAIATAFMQPQIPNKTQAFYENSIRSLSRFLQVDTMISIVQKTNKVAASYTSANALINNLHKIENEVLRTM
jgi:hypothetical protein